MRDPRHPRYKSPVDLEIGGEPRGDSVMLGSLEFQNGVYGSLTLCSRDSSLKLPGWKFWELKAS